MWDTNIENKVFSKCTGVDAGRNIVGEEIQFIAKGSMFSKGKLFSPSKIAGIQCNHSATEGSLVPLGNDAILGAQFWSVLLIS